MLAVLCALSVVAGLLVPSAQPQPAAAVSETPAAEMDAKTPASDAPSFGADEANAGESAADGDRPAGVEGKPADSGDSGAEKPQKNAVDTDAEKLAVAGESAEAEQSEAGSQDEEVSGASGGEAGSMSVLGAQARSGVGTFALGDGCSYANPGSGAYANTLCWLDLDGVTTQYRYVGTVTTNLPSESTWWGITYYYAETTITFESVLNTPGGFDHGTFAFTAEGNSWRNQEYARTDSVTNAQNQAQSNSNRLYKHHSDGNPGASCNFPWQGAPQCASYWGEIQYPIEIDVSAQYAFTATLRVTAPDRQRVLAVNSVNFPTWSGAFLGNNNFYTGVAGRPALYHAVDAGGTGVTAANRTTTVSLNDIQVRNKANNQRVAGYSIVVADAESTDNNEQIHWTHSGGSGFLWLPNNEGPTWSNTGTNTTANTARKTAAVGSACGGTNVDQFPQNSNTTATAASRTCIGSTSSKTGTAMLQISPQNATSNFSVTQAMQGGGRQAIAFGVVLAGAKVNVEVDDRVLNSSGQPSDANFTANVAASGYGSFTAATGSTALTGTSGDQFFPISTGSSSTLTFTSNPPAHGSLSSYSKSWVCYKSSGNDAQRERWPATGSSANPPTSPWTVLNGGQFMECTVTYTPPYLTLAKSVSADGNNIGSDGPGNFNLTATGRSANSFVSTVTRQGQAPSPSPQRIPVAVGTYDLTEANRPGNAPNWQFGYTWTGLSCTGAGSTSNVTTDPVSGAVNSPASVQVGTGGATRNVVCTYTNRANQPRLETSKTANVATGTAVNAEQVVTYYLTFDNSQGSAPIGADHVDHLADVLDDATFVGGSIRYGNNANVTANPPSSTTPIAGGPAPLSVTTDAPVAGKLVMQGVVPAHSVRTVSFQVAVRQNAENATDRQAAAAPLAGYLLRNYLTERLGPDNQPILPPATCEQPSDPNTKATCTEHPVRAWTVRKDSQPEDGAMIHSGGNIYYRVKITNFSGEDLTDVKVKDDLTETLAATTWDTSAPPLVPVPRGISYYEADGTLIPAGNVAWNSFVYAQQGGADPSWNAASATDPRLRFSGSAAFDPDFPGEKPFPGGTWTFETPEFDVPAEISGKKVAYAIVGYSVKGGNVASPSNPTVVHEVSGQNVNALPNAVWVNTAAAEAARVGSQNGIEPNRCVAPIAPGDTGANYDCKTWHSLGENYFHLWKKSANSTPVGENLVGANFLLADTQADALAGNVSRWLCRTEYAVPNPADVNSEPVTAVGGSTSQSTLDFGRASATHKSIEDANRARDTYNLTNGLSPSDPGYRPELPQCGLFFHLDTQDEGQAAGSWRAKDVLGGDTVANGSDPKPDWRETSAFNNGVNGSAGRHGTYWIVETKATGEHQLLAQPFKVWVAPNSPTPPGVSPGQVAFYDYQGRLSMPVLGETDSPPSGLGMAGGDAIRRQCASPYELPANRQPSCVMPTGWALPIFDVKLRPLPLTGGMWHGFIPAGATVLLLATIGGVLWWRRRQAPAHTVPSNPGGDTV